MQTLRHRFIVPTCILACAVSLGAWSRPFGLGRVQVDDRNHDGRPDIWRFFDAQGKLTRVAIDTNFDGRPDQEEQYQQEALTRRTSDRNFDQRVDLVEEFDPTSHQRTRSIVDVDFDGRADLLVLFVDGRPVHAEWASSRAAPSAASAGVMQGQLIALEDPFAATSAFRAHGSVSPDAPAVATLPALAVEPVAWLGSSLAPNLVYASPEGLGPPSPFSFASPRAPPSNTTR